VECQFSDERLKVKVTGRQKTKQNWRHITYERPEAPAGQALTAS